MSFVLEDHTFQQGAIDAFLFVVETRNGFELQPEVFVGATFVLAKKEHIRTDLEGSGNLPDYVERGLRGAGFVAAQLDRMNADAFGARLLREAMLLVQRGQSLWK